MMTFCISGLLFLISAHHRGFPISCYLYRLVRISSYFVWYLTIFSQSIRQMQNCLLIYFSFSYFSFKLLSRCFSFTPSEAKPSLSRSLSFVVSLWYARSSCKICDIICDRYVILLSLAVREIIDYVLSNICSY